MTTATTPHTPPAIDMTQHASTPALHTRGERPVEPTIFEKTQPGARGVDLPGLDVPETAIPGDIAGAAPQWPELGQLAVVRHYTHLSQRNFSVDGEFYPLGSCTMKYNPRINEWAAARPGFAAAHPHQRDGDTQGLLELLWRCQSFLAEVSGLPAVSLQPAAGAHGEYTALKIIRAYFRDLGQSSRDVVLSPDTAHGTNPASCAMCGAGVETIKTTGGYTDLDDLKRAIDQHGPDRIAAMMITNPNTAGLFDKTIGDIADTLHGIGALLYLDGANMNAILGKTKPADFGADIMHYNTHKTFSTPHGGGGPGAGPIAMRDFLEPYMPAPVVVRDGDAYRLDYDRPKSIGKVRSLIAQVGVLVRCYTYIRACGPDGLRNVAETSVLNANYIAARLKDVFEMPFFSPEDERYVAHEFVTVPKRLLSKGVSLLDIAKRLIDYGIHPPTMHWPVHDCLMVEPTETESRLVLDRFCDAMLAIADQIERDPSSLAAAPDSAAIRRADEVSAARKPVLVWERD